MRLRGNLVTVGINPAWDVLCLAHGLEWGDHKHIDEQIHRPAGKALNVSKSLAWMNYQSIASGLWGQEDYDEMMDELGELKHFIDVRFAAVRGRTRRNITIADTLKKRQMHLRLHGTLANKGSLNRLRSQMEGFVQRNDACVFAGSLPDDKMLNDVIEIMESCSKKGAEIIVDTSGAPLGRVINSGFADMVTPNKQEFETYLGRSVKDDPSAVARAASELLDHVKCVLVSMGKKGAVIVRPEGSWYGWCETVQDVKYTVGSGDWLLGGFLAGHKEDDGYAHALKRAIEAASCYTFGVTDNFESWQAEEMVDVHVEQLY